MQNDNLNSLLFKLNLCIIPMEVFEYTVCKYRTNVKCNFDTHLTENHKNNVLVLKCQYCDKIFSHKQSLHRHENHICKHNVNSKEIHKLQLKKTAIRNIF
jgi:uncharacterized C2H2 Zn-finger protein